MVILQISPFVLEHLILNRPKYLLLRSLFINENYFNEVDSKFKSCQFYFYLHVTVVFGTRK